MMRGKRIPCANGIWSVGGRNWNEDFEMPADDRNRTGYFLSLIHIYTKMRNVAGLSTSDAQKSSDMFAKCRYMDEITGKDRKSVV